MSDSKTTTSGGIGFAGLLTLIFITLKLTGFIAWSWFWVLSPIILSIVLELILLVVAGLIGILESPPMRRRKYSIA